MRNDPSSRWASTISSTDVGTKAADQLVLQVGDTHVEPESLHVGASELGAEAGALERAPERVLLTRVAQAGQPDVRTPWAELPQEAADGRRAPDGDNRDALGVEVAATARREGLERDLVAGSFNQHDRARVDPEGELVHLLSLAPTWPLPTTAFGGGRDRVAADDRSRWPWS